MVKVTASYPLNFHPGTMNPTPPGYRRHLESQPMSMAEAQATRALWAMEVESPGWRFEIVDAEGDKPASAL
jgi:hypothetical protein